MVTQQDIDKLKALLRTGERSVTIDGDNVTSHSPEDLRRTIREMEAELQAQTGYGRPPLATRRTEIAVDRDLGPVPPSDPRFDWRS